jgi:hypothetical protein
MKVVDLNEICISYCILFLCVKSSFWDKLIQFDFSFVIRMVGCTLSSFCGFIMSEELVITTLSTNIISGMWSTAQ